MRFLNKVLFVVLITSFLGCSQNKLEPKEFLQVEIFPAQEEHSHGATIVELPNGDMLAAWFQGHGERWADDVRIMGARLINGETKWSEPFVMADVLAFPDINPVLFIDNRETLWLVWYTVIANRWETSLPKYAVSNNYMQKAGAPEWQWQDVIYFKPGDKTERGIQPDDKFVKSVSEQMNRVGEKLKKAGATNEQLKMFDEFASDILAKARGENLMAGGKIITDGLSPKDTVLGYPYFRRMGWQTKNKPLQVGNKIILPFYSDGLEMSIMAITDDYGKTWSFSNPLVNISNIQPAMAVKKDGTIVAYMRDNGPPPNRHYISESKDGGDTWSDVTKSDVINPGSGSDIVTLANGNWVLAYNDVEDGRYSLAVSLSDDEGKTWKYTRHVETEANKPEKERSSFAYPSVIQGDDGFIHVVYSYHQRKSNSDKNENIKYVRFTKEWIKQGD
jgi:predicted neuraminidase